MNTSYGACSKKTRILNSRLFFALFFGFLTSAASAESLDTWLGFEVRKSTQALLANTSPSGAAKGAVVASPSRQDPDYFYHWTRDAALVMDTVIELRKHETDSKKKEHYRNLMWDFVHFSRANQLTPNRSGSPTGTGLGEPKFHADGRAFDGDWSRPQNDGPALRAVTLVRFAEELLDEGHEKLVRKYLYDSKVPAQTVIKADLEFVSHHWKTSSYDLWEEIRGKHFYTRMVQRRALIEGARLAERLGDANAAKWYVSQAQALSEQINWHWDSNRGFIVATLDRDDGIGYKGSGLDMAVVLGVLHGYAGDGFYSACDERVLLTAEALQSNYKRIYSINSRERDSEGSRMGVAIGRYPEDKYNGYHSRELGNPWFLLTNGMAELYYRCAKQWDGEKLIVVTKRNLHVIKQVLAMHRANVQVGEQLDSSDPRFHQVLTGLRAWGDDLLRRTKEHAGADGSMAEQMHRDSGYMQGAADLTWSYASLLTAAWQRN